MNFLKKFERDDSRGTRVEVMVERISVITADRRTHAEQVGRCSVKKPNRDHQQISP